MYGLLLRVAVQAEPIPVNCRCVTLAKGGGEHCVCLTVEFVDTETMFLLELARFSVSISFTSLPHSLLRFAEKNFMSDRCISVLVLY